jgi:methyl halide transferase
VDLGKEYWEKRWQQDETGWDIGYPSTPISAYFDQVSNKDARILIPGCGNGWEGEYLHNAGFKNVYLIDISETALKKFATRNPSFPKDHLLVQDFFELNEKFDFVIEQTFFCATPIRLHEAYVKKMHQILSKNGRLVGLLFDTVFEKQGPPFGGSKADYLELFQKSFDIQAMETAKNSIQPRAGRELFIDLTPKS